MADKNYEQIRVDLRPYGWGIRDVDVIPPEIEPGPDSVGSEEIKDEGVQMEDLSQEIQTKLNNAVDQQTVTETVNTAVQEAMASGVSEMVTQAVNEAVSEAVKVDTEENVRGIVSGWSPEAEANGNSSE